MVGRDQRELQPWMLPGLGNRLEAGKAEALPAPPPRKQGAGQAGDLRWPWQRGEEYGQVQTYPLWFPGAGPRVQKFPVYAALRRFWETHYRTSGRCGSPAAGLVTQPGAARVPPWSSMPSAPCSHSFPQCSGFSELGLPSATWHRAMCQTCTQVSLETKQVL